MKPGFFEPDEVLELEEEELQKIQDGGVVEKPARRFRGISTYFLLGDDLLRIQLQPDHTVWKMAASRIWFPVSPL